MKFRVLVQSTLSCISRFCLALKHQPVEMSSSSLSRQIMDGILRSSNDNIEFVPLDHLNFTITESNIRAELSKSHGLLEPSNIPDRVAEHSKRIFATLVLMDKIDAIHGLLLEGLTDEHLPLSRDTEFSNLLSQDKAQKFPFENWPESSVRWFISQQWLFLTPILKTTGQEIIVDSACALPFKEFEYIGGGAAGTVYKAQVHPAHQQGFNVSALNYESKLHDTE